MKNIKPWLSKSAVQFREQLDDNFADRDRRSDGWIGDARHSSTKSDHNPCKQTGVVRAIDIDKDISQVKDLMVHLVEQTRLYAKADKRKRISYIIFNGKIMSARGNWKYRTYKGFNQHKSHCHLSFSPAGDADSSFFDIPLLGGKV
jgi:hypothetical protein